MSIRAHFQRTFNELIRPSKAKLALTLLLAISAYLLLMATKEVYNTPSFMITDLGGDSAQLEAVPKIWVQLNFTVLVAAFPLAALAMLAMFGGIASNFSCDAAGACELATGTAWIYFAAVLINLPYYYWIASFITEGYKKVWQEEKEDRKEFKKPLKK